MKTTAIYEKLEINPIIAAIRHKEDIEDLKKNDVNVVFLLQADIINARELVAKIKNMNKLVFIHLDFIDGLGKDHKALEFICNHVEPHGIISTKSHAIKFAKEQGIFTVQRFFLVDSLSYETTIKTIKSVKPDLVEVMPGVIPKIISRLNRDIRTPIIAGGLISDKEDVISVLHAGALGVSIGNQLLWGL